MRKGSSIALGIVLLAIAAPVVAMHMGGGGWLRDTLISMHGRAVKSIHGSTTRHSGGDVTMPFELVGGHVVLPVTVNGSKPLSFIVDTGDKYGLIDIDRARELGLSLGAAVPVTGVGPGAKQGAFVNGATFAVPGVPAVMQPITVAMPLAALAGKLGHDFDGIVGTDFLSQFVVEVDYQARTITFHDRDAFSYHGTGAIVAAPLDAAGHPIVKGNVTALGTNTPIAINLMIDLGAAGALVLHSPFVAAHHLPGPSAHTLASIGHGGVGGGAAGRVGRVASLTIGDAVIALPITLFSEDTAGTFAQPEPAGNVGQRVLSQFRVFLDLSRERIILEPVSPVPDEPAYSGVSIESRGAGYKVFQITEIADGAPAAVAGLRVGDVLTEIDNRPAATWTLTTLAEYLQRPEPRTMKVQRANQVITATFTPKRVPS